MKKESRKLNLNRETLATMQSDELEGVNGGATPISAVSAAVSVSARASSKACIEGASKVLASALSAVSSYVQTRR